MTHETEWTAFFNDHAAIYETNCFTKNTMAEVDFLVEELHLTPDQSILDLGCGTGRHAIELARRGFRVTGLDVSPGMLTEARRNAKAAGVDVTWIEANACDFSVETSFDAVIGLCEGGLGLLGTGDDPIGQPQAILANVAQALKPNAMCLFTVLNAHALIRRRTQDDVVTGEFDPVALAERSECIVPDAPGPTVLRERAFVPTEIVLLFAQAGLEVLHIWGGTAGNWGRRPIDLDEIEFMAVARNIGRPVRPPYRVFQQP